VGQIFRCLSPSFRGFDLGSRRSSRSRLASRPPSPTSGSFWFRQAWRRPSPASTGLSPSVAILGGPLVFRPGLERRSRQSSPVLTALFVRPGFDRGFYRSSPALAGLSLSGLDRRFRRPSLVSTGDFTVPIRLRPPDIFSKNSIGVTPIEGPKAEGVGKLCDFEPITGHMSETVRDRAKVTINQ